MAEKKKIKLKENKYNPTGGPILRAGATVEIARFWADKWIAEDTAVEVKSDSVPAKGKNNGGKTGKSKS